MWTLTLQTNILGKHTKYDYEKEKYIIKCYCHWIRVSFDPSLASASCYCLVLRFENIGIYLIDWNVTCCGGWQGGAIMRRNIHKLNVSWVEWGYLSFTPKQVYNMYNQPLVYTHCTLHTCTLTLVTSSLRYPRCLHYTPC